MRPSLLPYGLMLLGNIFGSQEIMARGVSRMGQTLIANAASLRDQDPITMDSSCLGLNSLCKSEAQTQFLFQPLMTINDVSDAVTSLEFVKNNPYQLITTAHDGSTRLYDTRTGAVLWRLDRQGAAYEQLVVSDDGLLALTVGKNGHVDLINLADESIQRSFVDERTNTWFVTAAIAKDNKQVAAGTADGHIVIWDGSSGSQIQSWRAHENGLMSLNFSQDGGHLMSSDPQSVKLWNLRHDPIDLSRRLLDLSMGQDDVFWMQTASFSPDEKYVIAGSDNDVILFNLLNGSVESRFKGHTREIYSARMAPNLRTIVSSGRDGVVFFWDVDSGHAIGSIMGFNLAFPTALAVNAGMDRMAVALMTPNIFGGALSYQVKVYAITKKP